MRIRESMAKATSIKEAIANFEKLKGVSSAEAEKVFVDLSESKCRDGSVDKRKQHHLEAPFFRLNSWLNSRPLKSWMEHCQH